MLRRIAAILMVCLVLALASGPAHAKRGIPIPFIINTGEEIFDVGPLPPPYDQEPELAGWTAGYKCGVFGLVYAYIHWWDCAPVAYSDDTYYDDPELVAAITATYSESDMQIGVWGRFGRFLFLGLIGLWVFSKFSGDD